MRIARHLGDSDLSSLLLAPSSNNPSSPSRDVPRKDSIAGISGFVSPVDLLEFENRLFMMH